MGVSDYVCECGIVFKGDILIGIYCYSVDVWVEFELYNMEG